MRSEALEAVLATYLTDGHYNGIAIGVRNIDPMIFKHLANLKLIRSVFIVRGTGDTWCFGSYFPKKLSEVALNCLEGPRKPYTRIKDEVFKCINLQRFFKWIIEFEGDVFIQSWNKRLLLVIHITQYETLNHQFGYDSRERIRIPARTVYQLINEGTISPSKLWFDYLVEKISTYVFHGTLKYYKSYQLDINPRKTNLVHNYYFYADCTSRSSAINILEQLTLPNTWKGLITSILADTLHAYSAHTINFDDIRIIKKIINCKLRSPMKGPYNEYIMKQLPLIYPLILSGKERQAEARKEKLKKLMEYFTYKRKKSLCRLMELLTNEEREQLNKVARIVKPISRLIDIALEEMLIRKGGTPIGYLVVCMRLYKEPKIIISWSHCDEDHIKYAKALRELGIIEDYIILRSKHEILLISYRKEVRITPDDLARMFEMTLGFAPEDVIKETWFESFRNVKKGKITKYNETEIIIESSK